MSKQKRERKKTKKGPWFGVAVRKALQKTHSYSTKACAEESCTNPTTTAAWHCFRGGNFTAYRQTFEMLSLCSAALWRRFQEEADRRPGHNAELLARDSSTKISGKPNLQQKRFPLPINAYTCPAHLPSCSHLSGERFWQLAWPSWASCRSAQDLSLCPENMFFSINVRRRSLVNFNI